MRLGRPSTRLAVGRLVVWPFGLLTISFITIKRLWPQIMHLTPS